jgi:hypothetical protein
LRKICRAVKKQPEVAIMAMDHATYCAKVCGAKCCYLYEPHPIPCPKLSPDCSCSIYAERFYDGSPAEVLVGHFYYHGALRPFACGKIKDVLKSGFLSEEIAAQCCYAHPELLDIAGLISGNDPTTVHATSE